MINEKVIPFFPESDVIPESGAMMGKLLMKEFQNQVNSIEGDFRIVVRDLIYSVPDYILSIPSSPTGKYHPKDEINKNGMKYHIYRCLSFAEEIVRMLSLSDEDREILIAGCILHDSFKNGITNGGKTLDNHPILIYNYIKEFNKINNILRLDDLTRKTEKLALVCILHSGQWTPNEAYNILREDGVLFDKYKTLTNAMHTVDYLASRRSIYEIMKPRTIKEKILNLWE